MINLFGDSSLGQLGNRVLNRRLGTNAFGADPWNTEDAKDRQFEQDNSPDGLTPIMGQAPRVDPLGGIPDKPVGFVAPEAQGISLQNQVQNHGIMGIIAGLI